jgi:hypothetical protein
LDVTEAVLYLLNVSFGGVCIVLVMESLLQLRVICIVVSADAVAVDDDINQSINQAINQSINDFIVHSPSSFW